MAEAAKAVARQAPNFKLGQKQVFLPNHVVTLLRNKRLPPNEAQFKVPLRFTKFDLRDYLYNLYSVETVKIRSYVKENAVKVAAGTQRRFYRPQSDKIMIAELAQPFQWPELPADLEPWNHELWHKRQDQLDLDTEKEARRQRFKLDLKSDQPRSKERENLANLAKDMLSGKVKWSTDANLDIKWDKERQRTEAEDAAEEGAVAEGAPAEEAKDTRPPESR